MLTTPCKGLCWDSTTGDTAIWGHCGLGTLGERKL